MSTPHRFRIAVHLLAVLLVTALAAGPALAASDKPKAKAKTTATSKKSTGKVTYREAPSHEKPAERAKRLKRECKGRPNAGMCMGHTQ
jgi:hypothetical protein